MNGNVYCNRKFKNVWLEFLWWELIDVLKLILNIGDIIGFLNNKMEWNKNVFIWFVNIFNFWIVKMGEFLIFFCKWYLWFKIF